MNIITKNRTFLVAMLVLLMPTFACSESSAYKTIDFVKDDGTSNLQVNISYFEPSGKAGALTSNRNVPTGSTLRIDVVSKKDGYLYIYNVDSEGEFKELISLSKNQHKIKKGKLFSIPNRGKLVLRGTGQTKETVTFVLSDESLATVDSVSEMHALFTELSDKLQLASAENYKTIDFVESEDNVTVKCSKSVCPIEVIFSHQ